MQTSKTSSKECWSVSQSIFFGLSAKKFLAAHLCNRAGSSASRSVSARIRPHPPAGRPYRWETQVVPTSAAHLAHQMLLPAASSSQSARSPLATASATSSLPENERSRRDAQKLEGGGEPCHPFRWPQIQHPHPKHCFWHSFYVQLTKYSFLKVVKWATDTSAN